MGQMGQGVLVTIYPPPATTVAASAVALKSTAGCEMEVSVTVGALDGMGLGSKPLPPVTEHPRPSAKTNSMEAAAMAMCRLYIGFTCPRCRAEMIIPDKPHLVQRQSLAYSAGDWSDVASTRADSS